MLEFAKEYTQVIARHKSVIEINNKEVDLIAENFEIDSKSLSLYEYIVSLFAVLFLFGVAPLVYGESWGITGSFSVPVASYLLRQELLSKYPSLWVSFCFLFVLGIQSVILVPLVSCVKPRRRTGLLSFLKHSNAKIFDLFNLTFWFCAMAVVYFLLWLSMFVLIYFFSDNLELIHSLVHVILFLPFLSLPLFLVFIFIYLAMKLTNQSSCYRQCSRAMLMGYLISLIQSLDQIDALHNVEDSQKKKICELIRKIAFVIQGLPVVESKMGQVSRQVFREMKKPAQEFSCLISHVMLPNCNSKKYLIMKSIRCFNLAASGNLKGLAYMTCGGCGQIAVSKEGVVNRVLMLMLLMIYLMLPVIVYVLCAARYDLIVDEDVRMAGRLVYIIYVAVGLLVCLEKMSSDTRNIVFDLLRRIWPAK